MLRLLRREQLRKPSGGDEVVERLTGVEPWREPEHFLQPFDVADGTVSELDIAGRAFVRSFPVAPLVEGIGVTPDGAKDDPEGAAVADADGLAAGAFSTAGWV